MWREARARNKANRAVRGMADPHVHSDIAITPERLDAFADAGLGEQLSTLAVLRERSAESGATELAVIGLAIAVGVAIFVPPSGLLDFGAAVDPVEFAGRVVANVILAIAVSFFVILGSVDWIRRDRRREVAAVWLAAYEDDLGRRAAMRDRRRGGPFWSLGLRSAGREGRTVR